MHPMESSVEFAGEWSDGIDAPADSVVAVD
jgi:hypothetical protein